MERSDVLIEDTSLYAEIQRIPAMTLVSGEQLKRRWKMDVPLRDKNLGRNMILAIICPKSKKIKD